MDDAAAGNRLYMSLIVHTGWGLLADADAADYALVGFVGNVDPATTPSNELANASGCMVGFTGDVRKNSLNLVIRTRWSTSTGKMHAITEHVADGAHQIIIRIDHNNSGKDERIGYWIDPWSIESEARATETAKAHGEFWTDCLSANEPLTGAAVAVKNWDRKFFFDELRLATTFEDLTKSSTISPIRGWLARVIVAGAILAIALRLYSGGRARKQPATPAAGGS
jgi:hypothetical protein